MTLQLVATENLGRSVDCDRRFLTRLGRPNQHAWRHIYAQAGVPLADGDLLLAVDGASISCTPAGVHDSIRDAGTFSVANVRRWYAGTEEELRAELARLGGEYNPRTRY